MMFTVLGYQLEDIDLMAALATVRRHLDPGGLFIFDVWNGPAVLAVRPGERRVSVTEGSTALPAKRGLSWIFHGISVVFVSILSVSTPRSIDNGRKNMSSATIFRRNSNYPCQCQLDLSISVAFPMTKRRRTNGPGTSSVLPGYD